MIEKISLLKMNIDDMTAEQLQTFVLGQKINECIDVLNANQQSLANVAVDIDKINNSTSNYGN